MQSDDIIWDVISKNFCSYRSTFNKTKFCRNEYNVTGVCNKVSCPLANSRYATVREEQGVIYLYMKTVERAHTPSRLWEKIKLDPNFMKAIEQIDSNLEYWPGHMAHRVKQRFIRITQYLIRMRKMRKQIRRELVPINKKAERRDKTRENKALVAAHLTVNIKKELLERLNKGTYDEMNYFPQEVINSVLMEEANQDEMNDEEEEELEEEYEDEIDDLEDGGNVEYVEGDDDEDDFDDDDDEDFSNYTSPYGDDDEDGDQDDEEEDDDNDYKVKPSSNKRTSNNNSGPSKRKTHLNIEYEEEEGQELN